MKKMLLASLFLAVWCFAMAAPTTKNISEMNVDASITQNNFNMLDRQVASAEFKQLQARLQVDLDLLNQAADNKKLNDVITIGTRVMKEAERFKKYVDPNDKIAVINDHPTPGYLLWEAQIAEEFVVIAQILQHKTTLAKALKKHADLSQDFGLFAWITGRVDSINFLFYSMSEQFIQWKECPKAISEAQEKGLSVLPVKQVCR